eukprot:gb/GEZN01014666.1/.p1 GENE.gb/GEZN01014666.1/~~gb/GEZN01014666.1/.p1  ORF type:complete len:124 (-),score=8.26 gb/GEZN01014666.1/:171-542(-)
MDKFENAEGLDPRSVDCPLHPNPTWGSGWGEVLRTSGDEAGKESQNTANRNGAFKVRFQLEKQAFLSQRRLALRARRKFRWLAPEMASSRLAESIFLVTSVVVPFANARLHAKTYEVIMLFMP